MRLAHCVQDNALKGRQFNSLQAQNEYQQHWERTVADSRIHGTTRKHVREHFEVVEWPALLPLPAERETRNGHPTVAISA